MAFASIAFAGINHAMAVEPDAPNQPRLRAPMFSKNDASIYYDRDAYAPMLEIARNATKDIRVAFYIFGGEVAEELVKIMGEKKRQGLDVRIMLDPRMGGRPLVSDPGKAAVARIRAEGIPLQFATKAPINAGSDFVGMDHQKFVIVDADTDRSAAVVGSTNLSPSFVKYHDLVMKVSGPVVKDLAMQFDFDWRNARVPEAPLRNQYVKIDASTPHPTVVPSENEKPYVRMVGTGIGRKTVLRSLIDLLQSAEKSIHIQMHEMGVQPEIMTILRQKARQGVDVRIILDPNDTSAAHVMETTPTFERLKKGATPKLVLNACFVKYTLSQNARDVKKLKQLGLPTDRVVKVRIFPVVQLGGERTYILAHMKSVIVDGEKFNAGSTNWTWGGFNDVTETNLEIWGGKVPKEAERMFERDWKISTDAVEPGVGKGKAPNLALSLKACQYYRRKDPQLDWGSLLRASTLDHPRYWSEIRR